MRFRDRLKAIFWPIERGEVGVLLPISGLMFVILFFLNILKILKDSVLISELSAEIASFTKLYFVSPAAALFVVLYAKLVNNFSFRQIYSGLTLFFVAFYSVFAFLIYPNADILHMSDARIDHIIAQYPNLKWYVILIGNWSYVLFYTLCELAPNIFYLLLFWQLANEITTTQQAKRFYPFFSFFGNASLIPAGLLTMYLASENSIIDKLSQITSNKLLFVQIAVIVVIFTALASLLLVRYICKNIGTESMMISRKARKDLEKKTSLGLVDSFKYIASSSYLWLLLICSASYGLSLNLVEAVWKAKIKILYPSVNQYAAFGGLYTVFTGFLIMIMTIIGSNVMRKAGWFVTAVITPLIIMITGVLFFMFVVFDQEVVSFMDSVIMVSPLILAVNIGMVQNVLAKGSKYSIWDISRQMLYIPLDKELRSKGKAAVDVTSSKIGKSLSGLTQAIIFTIIPGATVISIAPFLSVVFIIVCILWIRALRGVYVQYKEMTEKNV